MQHLLKQKFRINIKSLTYESKAIRKEEKKTKGLDRQELYLHRTVNLREESRITLLAYGFCKSLPYKKIETTTKNPLTPEMIHRIFLKLKRKNLDISKEDVKMWLTS